MVRYSDNCHRGHREQHWQSAAKRGRAQFAAIQCTASCFQVHPSAQPIVVVSMVKKATIASGMNESYSVVTSVSHEIWDCEYSLPAYHGKHLKGSMGPNMQLSGFLVPRSGRRFFCLKVIVCREYCRNQLWLVGLAADLGGALLMIAAFALAPVRIQSCASRSISQEKQS